MKIHNYEVFRLHADFCKVMSSPKRLIIIDMLGKRPMNVGEIAQSLGTQPATVSQHLRLLRDKNFVIARKEGQTVYYSLAQPRMMDVCHMVREAMIENFKSGSKLAGDVDIENLIEDIAPRRTKRKPVRG